MGDILSVEGETLCEAVDVCLLGVGPLCDAVDSWPAEVNVGCELLVWPLGIETDCRFDMELPKDGVFGPTPAMVEDDVTCIAGTDSTVDEVSALLVVLGKLWEVELAWLLLNAPG